ncbi:hypothetical protein TNCV_3506931 [Trichonephila clavipes]|uniref:Uncharacterized protein n=1 Tax=Trichonephila clavipes TaxID=2585209 RepID=A0A8X6VCG0_TRICX|nr:hypothetical protein TNCV_3506931 [Trichonephila clavipes]
MKKFDPKVGSHLKCRRTSPLLYKTQPSIHTSFDVDDLQISYGGSGMCMIEQYLQKAVLTSTFIEETTKGRTRSFKNHRKEARGAYRE